MISRRSSRRGVALVITLAFVVLLTIVVVAFLSRSLRENQIAKARTEGVKVDAVARTVSELVLFDLRQEIAAGSRPDGAPAGAQYTVEGQRIYVPRSAETAGAQLVGLAGAQDPAATCNIVKISRATEPFFSGTAYDTAAYPPADFASAVSTGEPTTAGRYFRSRDWNKPLLLKTADLSNDNSELLPGVKLPDWIMLTDQGRKKITAPDSSVIGRFAYVIYDEGGLLDINVVGHPPSLPAADRARKGPLALADLSRIPGVQDPGELVAWRNHATGGATGFSGESFPSPSAHGYLKYVLNSPLHKGFTQIYPGDNSFLSRSDLLAFQAAHPDILAPESLQHLGTFTRGANRPTWSPSRPETINPSDPQPTFDYEAEAETSTWSNRGLANLRWPADKTIARPGPGGTTETIEVAKGDPVLLRRFPLSKIRLLEDPVANAREIAYYFGLRWVPAAAGAEAHWEYLHARKQKPTDTNGSGRKYIRTIEEVAALTGNQTPLSLGDRGDYPREPNFFELLQAGILRGSAGYNTIYTIGACIIDQYDSDNYPTYIKLDLSDAGVERNFWGIENLPYLSELLLSVYRPTDDPTRETVKAWIVPELWNPHRNAPSPATDPGEFRLVLQAVRNLLYCDITKSTPSAAHNSATAPGIPVTQLSDPDSGKFTIEFRNTADFREPLILNPGLVSATPNNPSASMTEGGLSFTGFYLGSAVVPDQALAQKVGIPPDPSAGSDDHNRAKMSQINGEFTLGLQYKVGNEWRTYSRAKASFSDPVFWATDAAKGADNLDARPSFYAAGFARRSFASVDPRATAEFMGDMVDPKGILLWRASPGKSWRPLPDSSAGYPRVGVSGGTADPDPDPFTDKVSQKGIEYTAHAVENVATGLFSTPDLFNMAIVGTGTISGDNVVRPGDAFRGNVFPMASGRVDDRPLILNRPFRSVAEMGYAYRGKEWHTIDFSSPASSDAALLDIFSISEEETVAGIFNPNTRNARTLEAMLSEALLNDLDSGGTQTLGGSDAAAIATAITTATKNRPVVSRAELATRVLALPEISPTRKTEREAVARALAESAESRVWNLLVDLIVQTGRYPRSASQLGDFQVEGERRIWLHLAIDRWTGELIEKQTEIVYE